MRARVSYVCRRQEPALSVQARVRKWPKGQAIRVGIYFRMLRLRSALHQDAYQRVVGEK